MSVSTILSDLGDRPPPADLETDSLPLPTLDYDVYATPDDVSEGKPWPPNRFTTRNDTLNTFRQLYTGDLSGLIRAPKSNVRVYVNTFRKYARVVTALGTGAPIIQTPEIMDPLVLVKLAQGLFTDQVRYGGAIVEASVAPAEVTVEPGEDGAEEPVEEGALSFNRIDPSYLYPQRDGGYILAAPFLSDTATSSTKDRMRVILVDADGNATQQVFTFQVGKLGNRAKDDEDTPIGSRYIMPIEASVTSDGWGDPVYADLVPLVLAQARRLTGAEHVQNRNETPFRKVMFDSDADDILATGARYEDLQSEKGRAKLLAQAAEDLEKFNTLAADFGFTIEIQEWSGNLAASQWYLQHLQALIAEMSGLSGLFEQSNVVSGRALKLLMVDTFAETLGIINHTRAAIEYLAGLVTSTGVVLEWPHFFDYFDSTEPEGPTSAMGFFTGPLMDDPV